MLKNKEKLRIKQKLKMKINIQNLLAGNLKRKLQQHQANLEKCQNGNNNL